MTESPPVTNLPSVDGLYTIFFLIAFADFLDCSYDLFISHESFFTRGYDIWATLEARTKCMEMSPIRSDSAFFPPPLTRDNYDRI